MICTHTDIYMYGPIPLVCKFTMHGWNKCNKSFTFHLLLHHFDLFAYKYKYTTTLFIYNNFASIINKTPVLCPKQIYFQFQFHYFEPPNKQTWKKHLESSTASPPRPSQTPFPSRPKSQPPRPPTSAPWRTPRPALPPHWGTAALGGGRGAVTRRRSGTRIPRKGGGSGHSTRPRRLHTRTMMPPEECAAPRPVPTSFTPPQLTTISSRPSPSTTRSNLRRPLKTSPPIAATANMHPTGLRLLSSQMIFLGPVRRGVVLLLLTLLLPLWTCFSSEISSIILLHPQTLLPFSRQTLKLRPSLITTNFSTWMALRLISLILWPPPPPLLLVAPLRQWSRLLVLLLIMTFRSWIAQQKPPPLNLLTRTSFL